MSNITVYRWMGKDEYEFIVNSSTVSINNKVLDIYLSKFFSETEDGSSFYKDNVLHTRSRGNSMDILVRIELQVPESVTMLASRRTKKVMKSFRFQSADIVTLKVLDIVKLEG